jgi:rRNA small subunit pseudouridine methyltransferase Nep1
MPLKQEFLNTLGQKRVGTVLHLILADSELERVPPEIAAHKVIRWFARKRARKPTELILNSSLHHPAMRGLVEKERRGRPDIVHLCLLLALDSPLNSEGLLKTYVHARGDKVIRVSPSTRIPRAYHRFEGLMESLFITKATPPENPLLELVESTLAGLVREINPKKTIAFSVGGEHKRLGELFEGLSTRDEVCALIGGFPHGDFLSPVEELADEVVCIYPKPLTAPAVLSRVIHSYEQRFGVL